MNKRLNTESASAAMVSAGLNQNALAEELGVSREAVSQWLKNKSFPRPNKLLQLSKVLSLSFDELVIKDDPALPIVAFRKKKGTKTKDHHIEKAQTMGMMLRQLVNYLPFDTLEMPPILKAPQLDYEYIQRVVKKVRDDIRVRDGDVVNFSHLTQRFKDLQAVIVPVLWGDKKQHQNALHIYLPDSRTTWVYLNLDVNVHDAKFWMAHELGHCLTPTLSGDDAEDFADNFAGALLFPEHHAAEAWEDLVSLGARKQKLQKLKDIAEWVMISPYTVYLQVNAYARHSGKEVIDLNPDIHAWSTKLNKQYHNMSETLFQSTTQPDVPKYIEETQAFFGTQFFDVLSRYLREQKKGPGIVQTLMDIPLLDARSIHAGLT